MHKVLVLIWFTLVAAFVSAESPATDEDYRGTAELFMQCAAVYEILATVNDGENPSDAGVYRDMSNGAQLTAWHFLSLAAADPNRTLHSFKDYTDREIRVRLTQLASVAENDSRRFAVLIGKLGQVCQTTMATQVQIEKEIGQQNHPGIPGESIP